MSDSKVKSVIVWDVDDVLNNLTRAWFEEFWLKHHKDCNCVYEQLVENPPHRLLGVDQEEYLSSLDKYRLSGAYGRLLPSPDVLAWFGRNGDRFRHMALSATPRRSASVTAEWVMRHFGHWIRCFSFVPSPREGESLPVYDRTKCEFLSWMGRGDVFVDDSRQNVEAVSRLGLKTILAPQPWNAGKETLNDELERLMVMNHAGAFVS